MDKLEQIILMDRLEQRILLDTEINNRCLNENIPSIAITMLKIWNKYNLELLSIIKSERIKINEYRSAKESK